MGSLNGDIMVMRNGRSTSQVSIYNYPEHLNPFYEDDQHKRLRFWKISKKDNEGRRNSFSIGNLKDMWAFKSFRMKKKSSTLGINKTSESPPTLRRDYALENGWNTFDHRLRGSTTSSINGDSFQRNATYRSSLQTLPTTNDRIGLNRNDGYRSTIQVTRTNPRYQPQQKQQQQHQMGVSQNRRSSQSSMVSTNPFESDDDDEDINTSSGMRSVNGGSTTTLTSRTPRKKRRAPAPPTTIHNNNNGAPPPTIRIESSPNNTQSELRIEEDIDIANLTAEIESFVKTKSNDDVESIHKDNVETSTTKEVSTPTKDAPKNVEQVEVRKEEETQRITTPKDTSKTKTTTITVVSDVSTKEQTKPEIKTNGHVTTEIVTVTTTRETKKPETVQKENNVAQVTNEIVTQTEKESKQINISNGAIPKKSNNISVNNSAVEEQYVQQELNTNVAKEELNKQETNTEDLQQKPVPLKRHTKPETEVGHVECIHVHVESPRATPRKEHPSGVSSFKTNETIETNSETITTKTPFVLTSPPNRRRKPESLESEPVTKETVKILETNAPNERTQELIIKEERVNVKPEIAVKPTLSPKPLLKEPNGKVHGFAEIHKPARKFINHHQNGHVRRASRDESVSPPTVPKEEIHRVEENKINNANSTQIATNSNVIEEKCELAKTPEIITVDKKQIVETKTTTSSCTQPTQRSSEEENILKIVETNTSNGVNTDEKRRVIEPSNVTEVDVQSRDNEFDLLYRPKPASHMEWKRSTLAPLETNIPPEKRKSVKDIIESINRSQRLLNAAANKDFTALQNHTTTTTTTGSSSNTTNTTNGSVTVSTIQSSETFNNNNFNENLKILDERENEIQRLVNEISASTSKQTSSNEEASAARAANTPSPSPSNCNNEYTEAQKLDNKEIFQKCKVKKEVYDYRESSPISSNLDWNPVPKPKRTKPSNE
ncbi:uncharacterized protein ACRADG_003890 isoform 2-T4 [Cochliomyia hominivorax]